MTDTTQELSHEQIIGLKSMMVASSKHLDTETLKQQLDLGDDDVAAVLAVIECAHVDVRFD